VNRAGSAVRVGKCEERAGGSAGGQEAQKGQGQKEIEQSATPAAPAFRLFYLFPSLHFKNPAPLK
jgi:hypothetical protein